MRNQTLRAKRMQNQGFRVYIQMITVIHKFYYAFFQIFEYFPIFSYAFFLKKIKNNMRF